MVWLFNVVGFLDLVYANFRRSGTMWPGVSHYFGGAQRAGHIGRSRHHL
jgi:hypothetical protein